MAASGCLLDIRDVEVRYGEARAVNGVSMSIGRGVITAIIGPNGAGKTSLLKAICGMQAAHTGEIEFDGVRIEKRSSRDITAAGIAHVPEGRRIFAKLTVEENLRLGGFLLDSERATRDALEAVYAAFPRLRERMRQRAGSLSGGEQQMLAIGRALMAKPRLIMADEVSQGLAPVVVQEVYRQLRAVSEQGVSVLLVEQNARLAFKLSQAVYVMEEGRIVLSGPTSDVAASAHVRDAYLGIR
ncbi:MAG: ABC transporter ATP-binding protein [Burkholderiales bacterium]